MTCQKKSRLEEILLCSKAVFRDPNDTDLSTSKLCDVLNVNAEDSAVDGESVVCGGEGAVVAEHDEADAARRLRHRPRQMHHRLIVLHV